MVEPNPPDPSAAAPVPTASPIPSAPPAAPAPPPSTAAAPAGNGSAGSNGGNRSGGAGAASRFVLPFVPLAIALVAQGALLGSGTGSQPDDTAAVCGDDVATYQECHSDYPTGCSAAGKYDAYLNLLKNQLVSPASAPQRYLAGSDYAAMEQALPSDLTKTNHGDEKDALAAIGDGHVVGLVGYLYYAKKGGKESSNCELTDPTDIDFHIGIGFDPALAAKLAEHAKLTSDERTVLDQSSVIVEMTPHWRARYEPSWTLDLLQPIVGRQVRVTGQQLADNEHFDPKDDCGVQDAAAKCWRASIWELHPVTRFEVCTSGTCTATTGSWVALEDLGAGSGGGAGGAGGAGSAASTGAAPTAAAPASAAPASTAPAGAPAQGGGQ